MKIKIGLTVVDISAGTEDETAHFLSELAEKIYDGGKWEWKQGARFTSEESKSWGNDIINALRERGY